MPTARDTVPNGEQEVDMDDRRALFNHAEFMELMKDVVFKLERFGPRDLPRLLGSLHEISWRDKHLFKIAEPMVVKSLPATSLQDLPRLVLSYVAARLLAMLRS